MGDHGDLTTRILDELVHHLGEAARCACHNLGRYQQLKIWCSRSGGGCHVLWVIGGGQGVGSSGDGGHGA